MTTLAKIVKINISKTHLFNQKLTTILGQSIQEKQLNQDKNLSVVALMLSLLPFPLFPHRLCGKLVNTCSLENRVPVKISSLAVPKWDRIFGDPPKA